MKDYPHIFFDLDHTLWDFNHNSMLAICDIMAETGVDQQVDPQEFVKHYRAVNSKYWAMYREGKLEKSILRTIRFEKALEQFGIKDRELSETFASRYIEISPRKTTLVEGTIPLLDGLIERDVKLHVITNGFEEVQHIKLNQSKLSHYFDVVLISEKVGQRKPHPIVFEEALAQAGARAEESLMVGDNLEVDILGAKQVGMDQAYYNPDGLQHDEDITFEMEFLHELKNWLRV